MPNNQQTRSDVRTEQETDLAVVACCLRDYLVVHGKNGQPYQILRFLADGTLDRLADGKTACFNYLAIRQAVTGETKGDASAWFSRHWKAFNGEFREKCEEGIQKFASDQGLNVYPWISKRESDGGAGNQALVSLVALPVPSCLLEATHQLPEHDIAYIPAENLQPSWWARWLFDKELIAQGWRKGMLVWPTLLWMGILCMLTVLLLYALSQNQTPITTRDAVFLVYTGLTAWYARYVINRLIRLVDDRIVMASDSMVGYKEFGACLELFKPEGTSSDAPRRARMIKYAATCPTCGAQVLLDQGEPDFRRRIVGRCQESPREHVFSFDRATRTGYRLR